MNMATHQKLESMDIAGFIDDIRPIQILLGNFPATLRISSNFFVREQLLATFLEN